MELHLDPKDERLARFENMLASMGEGAAGKVFARALNHEGDKRRTQVQRSLAKAAGVKYRDVAKAIKTIRAKSGSLEYRLIVSGAETNLAAFGARQTKLGVSAAPWGVRRVFKSTFIIRKYGGKVYKRTGEASRPTQRKLMDYGQRNLGRLPIRQVYGPNLAREVVKGKPIDVWQDDTQAIIDRVGHEIEREMVAEMTGMPMGNWAGRPPPPL